MSIPYDPFSGNGNMTGAAGGNTPVGSGPNRGGAGKKVRTLADGPTRIRGVRTLPNSPARIGQFGGNVVLSNGDVVSVGDTGAAVAPLVNRGAPRGYTDNRTDVVNARDRVPGQIGMTDNRAERVQQVANMAAGRANNANGSSGPANQIARINGQDPTSGSALPFMFNGQEINALQAQNILSNPSALSAFLLGNLGYGDTPTMRAMLDPYMQNLPILQLLQIAGLDMGGQEFGGLIYNPDGSIDYQRTLQNNPELAGMLTAEGGFNAGADLMRSQFGAGLDPLQLMGQYFQTGRPGDQGTVGAEVFGGRSPADQVSLAKDVITASMMNGNPYMVGVLRALIDALGTTYQAQGATDPNGFAGWLLQNSLFGPLMQGAIGGTGR